MRVILKSDIPSLGRAGEIKEVKNGFARNYLIPRGLVLSADGRSQKERQFLENVQQKKILKRKKTAEETAKTIHGKVIEFTLKAGEEGKLFGSVTNIGVQKKLEEAGFPVDRRSIHLEEPIKTVGTHEVEIRLHEGVVSKIQVIVKADAPIVEKKAEEPPAEESVPETENQTQESAE
ncbi:MAG: 50S ribosomal protein L9 [Leptospiraceae bacterium]|nr:50S ribosomal protein L9 [Leptospiraceae bacterium]